MNYSLKILDIDRSGLSIRWGVTPGSIPPMSRCSYTLQEVRDTYHYEIKWIKVESMDRWRIASGTMSDSESWRYDPDDHEPKMNHDNGFDGDANADAATEPKGDEWALIA